MMSNNLGCLDIYIITGKPVKCNVICSFNAIFPFDHPPEEVTSDKLKETKHFKSHAKFNINFKSCNHNCSNSEYLQCM